MKTCLKRIYSKDYFIFLGLGFLPLIWKILELAILSSFENSIKILGQTALIAIIFKVFEESLLNPLYKILGKNNNSDEDSKNAIAQKFLFVYVILTLLFTACIFAINKPIIKMSMVPNHIISETFNFLKIYIFACGVGVISKYLYTFSVINKNTKNLFVYLLIKAFATAVLFLALIPKFTLGLGIQGVAVAELIVNLTTVLFLIFTFPKSKNKNSKLNKKEYFKLFAISLTETLIRNVVYYFVILVLLNMLDNQDLYFVANDFIWSIMLVPAIAQNILVKQAVSNNETETLKPFLVNCLVLIGFMLLMLPVAFLTFKHVFNFSNYLNYFEVLLKLFPCYIIFVFDGVIESYFFASGKLHHILIQNIITNVLIYLVAYVLFLSGVWIVTLNSILLLFNLGVVVSSIYTISAYCVTTKKVV